MNKAVQSRITHHASRITHHASRYDYILIAGYGWSGSSAVVDILHEFKSCYLPGIEFVVVKDPYGLDDLCHAVIKGSADTALKDFISYMNFLNRIPDSFHQGLGYAHFFGDTFERETKNFVDSLVNFEYANYWWMFDFRECRNKYSLKYTLKFIFNRIMRSLPVRAVRKLMRILHLTRSSTKAHHSRGGKSYFVDVSRERFMELSRKYIDAIFAPFVEAGGQDFVVLDQAVPAHNYKSEMEYFRDSKLIVVDRDPRDNFAELIKLQATIGREFAKGRDISKYVEWHSWRRSSLQELKNDPNVLFLRFEDLIYHYEDSLKRIAEFAGLNLNDHVRKREFFNPDVSIKNVGIWKTDLSQEEADRIASELPEFLYER